MRRLNEIKRVHGDHGVVGVGVDAVAVEDVAAKVSRRLPTELVTLCEITFIQGPLHSAPWQLTGGILDECSHAAACYGAFIAGSTVELRELLAAARVTDGITPAFGQRLDDIVYYMDAIDDGHRFRLAYLRKQWDTQMHHGDTFALDVVLERYLRPDTENLGSPELSELQELYKDRVYDANIASAAKITARRRFGGALRRNDRDRDGGGARRENLKTTRPGRKTVEPRATFANDAIKDCGKGKAKVEAPIIVDMAE
eukprot:jgi/Tetstr1/423222/TSEL_001340.t1